eukprot:gb/GECH01014041.1/.p1 GENE.gb/GECH01014041.1/~~gb/GECH01014041.1/.p1  ORF type:complete len:325 (+),score=68.61 gb/GECH01014041.1/:1-975(+)
MFEFLYSIYSFFTYSLIIGALISLITFFVPVILQSFVYKPQDLKKKYNAKWAVVTGGSSGIGKAIVQKLASQGINVVIVALDDELLRNFHSEVKKQFPDLEFRAVGVNLGGDDYLEKIRDSISDISISLLFNNAGFIVIGLFSDMSLEKQMVNYNVNATAATKITHVVSNNMIENQNRGAIIFTSSPAGLMPCPFNVIYGSTKAYLTEFATSIAPELSGDGIDVLLYNPSPVDTNFYKNDSVHKSISLLLFKKTAITPAVIAQDIFACVGRFGSVVRDQGYFSVGLRILLKLVDPGFLAYILSVFGPMSAEYKNLIKERKSKTE